MDMRIELARAGFISWLDGAIKKKNIRWGFRFFAYTDRPRHALPSYPTPAPALAYRLVPGLGGDAVTEIRLTAGIYVLIHLIR